MDKNLAEQGARATKAPNQEELPSTAETRAVTGELSQAVGKYALLGSQVDVRIASHLIEISDEVKSLGARVEKLERELASSRKRATRSGAHA